MEELPNLSREETLRAEGYQLIAGIDEVGRGALAGPVVAAAVILPRQLDASWVAQVRDSKQLPPAKRQSLCPLIQEASVAWGVGMVSPEGIDAKGIVEATRQAMCLAVGKLAQPPDFLLIDALVLPSLSLPQKSVIHGDRLCLSIACASIIAKVTRDKLMEELDSFYPNYGFKRHKGYGTSEHLASLRRWGPSQVHRQSFYPVGKWEE